MPVKDHVEMGFSGANGDPGIDSLINKLENVGYYDTLFTLLTAVRSLLRPSCRPPWPSL